MFLSQPCETPTTPRRVQVMLATFGRSGTASLALALNKIGFAAMHGANLLDNPDAVRAFVYANASSLLDVTEAGGYDVTMEVHAGLFEELYALRPDVKVIATERDFDSHYDSFAAFCELYTDPTTIGSPVRFPLTQLPFTAPLNEVMRLLFNRMGHETADCFLGYTCRPRTPEHRALFKRGVDMRNEFIRAHVPKEQLLRLRLGTDGYPELCRFLGVPADRCPSDPFPHVNTRAELLALHRVFVVIELVSRSLVLAVVILAVVGLRTVWRSVRAGRKAPTAIVNDNKQKAA